MRKNKTKEFNLAIFGVGGQGLITLLRILATAALFENYEIRTSELHGLSQRGGSVKVHIRFGEKIFSPLISQGKANLILALEMQEGLKSFYFAGKKTFFLINKFIVPIPLQKSISQNEIFKIYNKFSKKVIFIPASEICQRNFKTKVTAGIFLLSLASFKGLIPLKPNSILKAIKKIIPAKYLELNLKTFKLAKTKFS